MELNYAYGINDLGQIVGFGRISGSQVHALRTPVPEPSTLILLAVGVIGLVARRLPREARDRGESRPLLNREVLLRRSVRYCVYLQDVAAIFRGRASILGILGLTFGTISFTDAGGRRLVAAVVNS